MAMTQKKLPFFLWLPPFAAVVGGALVLVGWRLDLQIGQALAFVMNLLCPILFALTSFVGLAFVWGRLYFGVFADIEAFWFTLRLPTDGADRGIVRSCLKFVAVAVPSTLGLAWALYFTLAWLSVANAVVWWLGVVVCLLYVAVVNYYFLEYRGNAISFLTSRRASDYTTMYEEHFAQTRPADVTFDERRNVILLLLESIEDSYGEGCFGADLIPGLRKLRAEGLSFYGSHNTRGATWTMGAIVAFTTGLPMGFSHGSSSGNAYGKASGRFMPGVCSIFEILEVHGYSISFFLGSDMRFSGKDNFFATHSKSAAIYDIGYFDEKRRNGEFDYDPMVWGAPDRVVYSEVKKRLASNAHRSPFFVILETVDTHFPKGRFNGIVERKYGDARDCILEADIMASDFVAWLQKQDFYKNTSVVVLGDHLYMRDRVGPVKLPPLDEREPYNAFFNTGVKHGQVLRDFGAFDFAPTILEAAGARWPGRRLGLGVSLFDAGQKTLFEEKGRSYYEREVRKKSNFYDSLLWKGRLDDAKG